MSDSDTPRIPGLTKAQCRAVERLFISQFPSSSPVQLHPKTAQTLMKRGFVVEQEMMLPGWPPVKIVAHQLTLTGHMAYCQAAGSEADSE